LFCNGLDELNSYIYLLFILFNDDKREAYYTL